MVPYAFRGPMAGVSIKAANIFALLTLFLFFITPATFVFWIITDLLIWYVPLAFILSKFFLSALRLSQSQYLISAAYKDPQLYNLLVNNGAFLFHPETSST